MESKPQPNLIRDRIDLLIRKTRNVGALADQLQDYKVLSSSEVKHIKTCSDDPSSCHLLYELIASQLPSAFNLLIFALHDTDNDQVSHLLESLVDNASSHGELDRSQASSPEVHRKQDTKSLPIAGAEMGISEILEEYSDSIGSLKALAGILKIKDSSVRSQENFVIGATLILREWTESNQTQPNVNNLCNLLDSSKIHKTCSDRIRRMVENYVDTGFAFDFPGHFTIAGKEEKIARLIDDNPSFCLHPERLYLLLNLPATTMSSFIKENMFVKNAISMLKEWRSLQPKHSSVDHLAALMAFNGHFCTAGCFSFIYYYRT